METLKLSKGQQGQQKALFQTQFQQPLQAKQISTKIVSHPRYSYQTNLPPLQDLFDAEHFRRLAERKLLFLEDNLIETGPSSYAWLKKPHQTLKKTTTARLKSVNNQQQQEQQHLQKHNFICAIQNNESDNSETLSDAPLEQSKVKQAESPDQINFFEFFRKIDPQKVSLASKQAESGAVSLKTASSEADKDIANKQQFNGANFAQISEKKQIISSLPQHMQQLFLVSKANSNKDQPDIAQKNLTVELEMESSATLINKEETDQHPSDSNSIRKRESKENDKNEPIKRRRKKVKLKKEIEAQEIEDGGFKCLYCPRIFSHSNRLGGHVSKRHPGCSDQYRAKQLKREERTMERALLKEAKHLFYQKTGLDPRDFRSKVTQIKKSLFEMQEKSVKQPIIEQ